MRTTSLVPCLPHMHDFLTKIHLGSLLHFCKDHCRCLETKISQLSDQKTLTYESAHFALLQLMRRLASALSLPLVGVLGDIEVLGEGVVIVVGSWGRKGWGAGHCW